MGANTQNTELMQALQAGNDLKIRGFTAVCGPTGGVVIDRWNHVRGVWQRAWRQTAWRKTRVASEFELAQYPSRQPPA